MEYKYKLNIYPMALLDMEQIYRYIAVELCNPTAATKQMQDIKKAFENICTFPESCPLTNNEQLKDRSLRKMLVNKYIIFYRIKNKEIHVVRIIYGMSNYESIL